MVKVTNVPPLGRSTRRPGFFVATKTRGGVKIVKGWPKKRGKKANPEQKHNQKQFALAQQAANEAIPWAYLEADNISTGTIFNRREILVKAAMGTLYEVYLEDGSYYGNWFTMAKEIQGLLDTISDTVGSMLVRTGDGWAALVPGTDGYVLRTNGEGFPPAWQAIDAPEVAYQWSSSDISSVYAGANITMGNQYVPMFDVEVVSLAFRVTPDATKTYSLCIAQLSAGNVITAIDQLFDITAAVFANPNGFELPLPVAQVMTAGQKYGVFISKSNGPVGAGVKVWNPFQGPGPFPLVQRQLATFFNVAVPTVGQACVTSGGVVDINFKWREL